MLEKSNCNLLLELNFLWRIKHICKLQTSWNILRLDFTSPFYIVSKYFLATIVCVRVKVSLDTSQNISSITIRFKTNVGSYFFTCNLIFFRF